MKGTEYPKIQGLWKRNQSGKLINGYSRPEFACLAEAVWLCTEKVDGTNIRIGQVGGAYFVGGRTDAAQLPGDLLAAIEALDLRTKLWATFGDRDVVLYGEGYGPGIQKGGGNYRDTKGFVLFDAKIGGVWAMRSTLEDIAKALGLDIVPVVFVGPLTQAVEIVRHGMMSTWSKGEPFQAEGLVCRPVVTLLDHRGERITTKVRHKDTDDLRWAVSEPEGVPASTFTVFGEVTHG